jgi:hypothetical protein
VGALRNEQSNAAIALQLQGELTFEFERGGEQHRR